MVLRIALVVVFINLICHDESAGQNRGRRLFQKIRNDLTGNQNQTQEKNADSNVQAKQASGNTGSRLSAATPSARREPTPLEDYSNQPSPSPRSGQLGRPPHTSQNVSGLVRQGFGFTASVNDQEQLYVAKVDRNGNAAEAGLRPGDLILEIGGIESSSTAELDEIAKVMGAGDQLEFKIKRNGREEKITIQFGEQQKMPDSETNPSANVARRYDFAPPAEQRLPDHFPKAESVLSNRVASRDAGLNGGITQRFSDQTADVDARIRTLNQTIANQNRQIQQLQYELSRLRQPQRSR
jgi:hypothetical protein